MSKERFNPAGRQLVELGEVQVGDVIVCGPIRSYFEVGLGSPWIGAVVGSLGLDGYDVYRKIPVPSHRGAQGPAQSRCATEVGMTPAEGLKRLTFIPQGDAERKAAPLFRGLLGYFPAALFGVAAHSLESDRKHNGIQDDAPYWARGKSSDHIDCQIRHIIDAGGGEIDEPDTEYHLRSNAWRALALYQEWLERNRGARPGVRSVFEQPDECAKAGVVVLNPTARRFAEDPDPRQ